MENLEFLKKLPIFFDLNDKEITSILTFFNFFEKSFQKMNLYLK